MKAADKIRCGWLYALYQPPVDPKTDKPLDATKPVGQWNHIRLVISPEKCVHEINGVTYFEYVLGSEDFKSRVAKSKFARMPLFAKFDSGLPRAAGGSRASLVPQYQASPTPGSETAKRAAFTRHRGPAWHGAGERTILSSRRTRLHLRYSTLSASAKGSTACPVAV